LTTLVPDGSHAAFKRSTTHAQVAQTINRGLAWIGANFAPGNGNITGPSPYYMLYGIERIGALGDRQTIGRVDWYAKGADYLHSTQHGDGSWNSVHGAEVNTVWATLFLTK